MKILLITFALLALASCAHHDESVEHHHHTCEENCSIEHKETDAFNKHCAHSVAEGNLDVMGSEEYMVSHKGMDYYFSSKKNMELFKKNVQKEIEKAKENWTSRRYR